MAKLATCGAPLIMKARFLRCSLPSDRSEFFMIRLRDILRNAGYSNTVCVNCGLAALRELRTGAFSFLLTGWHMSPVTGLELTKIVRKDKRSSVAQMPIIMLCDESRIRHMRQATSAGVTEVVTKRSLQSRLSSRITDCLNDVKHFIRSQSYVDLDRRRQKDDPWPERERRLTSTVRGPTRATNSNSPNNGHRLSTDSACAYASADLSMRTRHSMD